MHTSAPADAGSAHDVAAWWGALSAIQRQNLVLGAPALIGNLEGVTYRARDFANRIVLDRRIAEEVAGAHYDRVNSIAGAGMPADWEEDRETAYFHWSYVDALSMAQSTSLVWDRKIPSTHPAFQSTIHEREGDFDLYLPGPGHGQVFLPNPPPSIPATTDPMRNHDLIASQQVENQNALRNMYLATEAERKR